MAESKNSKVKTGVYSIKDPFSILLTGCALIISGIIALVVLSDPSLFGIVFVSLLIAGSLFRLRAVKDGVALDLSSDTMSFPGGGVAANEITDYISIDYLFQFFKRTTIELSSISEIRKETIQTTSHKNGRTTFSYTHYIKFVGTFGAAYVKFSSEGKRDQLYNAIRQANRMGTAVFKA